MDSKLILIALKKAGSSVSKIATDLGVKPVSIYSVISGQNKVPRVRDHIACVLRIPVTTLWPPELPAAELELAKTAVPSWYRGPKHAFNPGPMGHFSFRFVSELIRTHLTPDAIAAIVRLEPETVQVWLDGTGDLLPDAGELMLLHQATQLDVFYILTGVRGPARVK